MKILALAFLTGFWSLAAQFVFNRIIFFYVANSEYVAATIISLHLAGFLVGTLIARRHAVRPEHLVVATLLLTLASDLLVWQLGAAQLGLVPVVLLAALSALLLATLSGALVLRLMQDDQGVSSRGVIIADSAGSVAGALIAGFLIVPWLGLSFAFAIVLAFQMAGLVLSFLSSPPAGKRTRWAFTACIAGLLAITLSLHLQPPGQDIDQLLIVDRMPVGPLSAEGKLEFSAQSPFGLLTVTREPAVVSLRIDNRLLCYAITAPDKNKDLSEWQVGEFPARFLADRTDARIANIGLGCGVTLAAILAESRADTRVDLIEINPAMPAAQKAFSPLLPHGPDDARVSLHLTDGFRYFSERKGRPVYDAVIIDTAWMQNMNATHLFSREMYANVRASLKDDGVLAVWSEELNPFSSVSLIIFRTLQSIYPEVIAELAPDVVLFYASPTAGTLQGHFPRDVMHLSQAMAASARNVPINRLDNLVMNRHKFSVLGDSHWEVLAK